MPYPNWPNVPGTWGPNQYNQYRYPGQQYANYPSNTQQANPQGNLIWVSGVDGAKAYPMEPNSTVLLLDSQDPYAYLKTTDAANFPTLERFRIEKDPMQEIVDVQPQQAYATREEVSALSSKIDGLTDLLERMKPREFNIDVKGAAHAESDIQQPSAATTNREPGNGSLRVDKGGNDWKL